MAFERLRKPWLLFLLLGLLATAGYFALPSADAQTIAYDIIGLSAVAAIAAGIWWHRPTPRAPWILIALGETLAICGDAIWTYDQTVRGIETPFPSFADALYLGGTTVLCAGVLLLAHIHVGSRDHAALIDTAILAIGSGLLSWVFLIDPQWDDSARPLVERLVATAYPAIDLLILAVALRLVLSASGRTVALRLLVAALASLCTADVVYSILLAQGRYQTGHPIDAGWLLAYTLFGTLALHPSMHTRPGTVAGAELDLSRRRLVLLALAALIGPGLLVLQAARNVHLDVPLIVAASALLFLLAIGRLHLLADALREREARFRALVQRSTDGVAIVGADGLARYQSPAIASILGRMPKDMHGNAFAHIHPDDLAAARQMFDDLLAESGGDRLRHLRVQHADGSWRVLEVRGTNLLSEPSVGGIVVNYRDITIPQETEAERQQLVGTLHERVKELTALHQAARLFQGSQPLPDLLAALVALLPAAMQHPELAAARITFAGITRETPNFAPSPWRQAVPIATSGSEVGSIEVLYTAPPPQDEDAPFVTEERALLTSLAEMLQAHNDRLLAEAALREAEQRSRVLSEEAQRRARELALLDQVRTALAGELDPAGIHRAIVEATAEVFPRAKAALYLVEGGELVLQQITGTSNDLYLRMPLSRGLIGRAARTGQPVLVEDVDTDPDYIRAHPEVVSEICVPLLDEGQVIGVLNTESAADLRLGADDLRLLIAIGHHTSTALVRARLYAETRASAARLAAAQAIAHLGSWEYDFATGELRYSDEVFRIGGYPPQSFVPSPERMIAAVHPDDRDRVRRAYQASLEGAPYDIDHRIVRPDGEVRIVHQQAEFIKDASGRPIRRVGVVQDITERRSLEARLQHQAFHDPLTGLPNRALLRDRLSQAIARAGRGEHVTCAVLLLDLDRFKTVNDSLGHAVGDRLLVAATARLRTALRDGDTLARLGGDEFVVLLEDVEDLAEALRVAERLHAALDTPLVVEDRALFATASIGVALRSGPEDGPEDLLRFADVALYRAKEAGRACTEAFYPGMNAATLERLDLEHDLRLALERNELVAYYQPKVDLTTGRVTGLEALVRWQHPERGLVPPGEFIPLAEETGLISPLGRWVLEEACRQLVAWRTMLPHHATPFVSVNLSARQFRNPDLAAEVAAVLAETGLPPYLLTLEVTETVAMARPEAGVATLRALKDLGVQLALDDFGTGYSSLAYLQQLPVDGLKIDRAFFRPGERNRVIVRAVAELARGLGLNVTAEGLEMPEQVAWAREVGCDLGQGFYFSRPVPAEEIEALWALGLTFDLPEHAIPVPRSSTLATSRRPR